MAKKCKECGEPFEPKYNTAQMVCSALCAANYSAKQKKKKAKEWRKRKRVIKEKLQTYGECLKLAQAAFNGYIRERDKGKVCVSCPTILSPKIKFDAGHFFAAGNYSGLRFDELNVHGQCVRCNRHEHGNLQEYRNRLPFRLNALVDAGCTHGEFSVIPEQSNKLTAEQAVFNLTRYRHDNLPFDKEELREIAKTYRNKTRKLRQSREKN